MPRTKGSLNKGTIDFLQAYDRLAAKYIDPLELMFAIASNDKGLQSELVEGEQITLSQRSFAAKELLGYRYPRLKAIELQAEKENTQLEIGWLDDLAGDDSSDNDPLQTAQVPEKPAQH